MYSKRTKRAHFSFAGTEIMLVIAWMLMSSHIEGQLVLEVIFKRHSFFMAQ